MIEIAELTDADQGRIIVQSVTPHIAYEGALVAWNRTYLVVAFPKHARHGKLKWPFICELVKPNDANFKTGKELKR